MQLCHVKRNKMLSSKTTNDYKKKNDMSILTIFQTHFGLIRKCYSARFTRKNLKS